MYASSTLRDTALRQKQLLLIVDEGGRVDGVFRFRSGDDAPRSGVAAGGRDYLIVTTWSPTFGSLPWLVGELKPGKVVTANAARKRGDALRGGGRRLVT